MCDDRVEAELERGQVESGRQDGAVWTCRGGKWVETKLMHDRGHV